MATKQVRGRADYKRLICCADGTWLASNTGQDAVPSNVAKLARAISTEGIDQQEQIVPQIVQYQSGLGSTDLPFQRAIAGGIGLGLDADICQMYDFLANNYSSDRDELFFFGFSRGAYTVRSVAGLVCDTGILPAVKMNRFPEMWKEYRKNTDGGAFKQSQWFRDNQPTLGLRSVRIKVVGVWETVGSIGLPDWMIVKGAARLGFDINKAHTFYNTRLSTNLDYAFQALALDEKRLTFLPILWHKNSDDGPEKALEQCWFPGVNSNVGGQAAGHPGLGDGEEIGDNALAWMVDNLSEHHRLALNRNPMNNAWGSGPIVDNFYGLQGWFFWLLGRRDRTPGSYYDGTSNTHESFHPMVRIRRWKISSWKPASMAGFELIEPCKGTGWKWQRRDGSIMHEWVMHGKKTMTVRLGDPGSLDFSTQECMSQQLCPGDIWDEIEQENKRLHDVHEHVHNGGQKHLQNGVHKHHQNGKIALV